MNRGGDGVLPAWAVGAYVCTRTLPLFHMHALLCKLSCVTGMHMASAASQHYRD